MKILELFAGSRSVGKEAEKMGFEVFSVDKENFNGIDLVIDIENLEPHMIPFVPDIVWGSPLCTTYSIAAISHHRNGTKPKTEIAEKSDRLVKKTLDLIGYYECIYFIENPVGMLRKMPFMRGLPRATITYCQYGDTRMKPTDIWSNHIYSTWNPYGWIPRPMCKNGMGCHDSAPRGSQTGTQGLKNNYERSKIPSELCREILQSLVMVEN